MNRKATAAALSGLVCPGAGQIYNKEYLKGGVLVAASLGLVAALLYELWDAMVKTVLSMPPEEVRGDVFGIAHRLVQENRATLSSILWALLAVWAYAVADAYIRGDRAACQTKDTT